MNDLATRVDEYLASEFRRYFPDCHEVDVDQREDETIHVDVLFAHPRSYNFLMEIGSDDDFYVFTECTSGMVITIPYPDFLTSED